jgi:protein ImuA
MSRWEKLASLRATVARIERGVAAARGDGALPLGLAAIDRALGEGGLRRAALHEVSGHAADGFAAVVAGRAARGGGSVLWCGAGRGGGGLYPPGLAMLGLDPASLLLVDCRNERELMAVAEEGLRNASLAALLLEIARMPDMTAARRLQLAAEAGGVLGMLLCPGAMAPDSRVARHRPTPPPGRPRRTMSLGGRVGERAGAGPTKMEHIPPALPPSPAVSRWRVGPAPAGPGGGFRWRLELLRCRGGGAGKWMVDWNEKTHCLDLVSPAGD